MVKWVNSVMFREISVILLCDRKRRSSDCIHVLAAPIGRSTSLLLDTSRWTCAVGVCGRGVWSGLLSYTYTIHVDEDFLISKTLLEVLYVESISKSLVSRPTEILFHYSMQTY